MHMLPFEKQENIILSVFGRTRKRMLQGKKLRSKRQRSGQSILPHEFIVKSENLSRFLLRSVQSSKKLIHGQPNQLTF